MIREYRNILGHKIMYENLAQNAAIPPDQNASKLFDQNVLILLVISICNGNIQAFWSRKLCMKIQFKFFLYGFLDKKCPDTPKSHTTDGDHYWLSFGCSRFAFCLLTTRVTRKINFEPKNIEQSHPEAKENFLFEYNKWR